MARILMALAAAGCLLGASMAKADPVEGKIVHRDRVEARSVDTYTVWLRGGETTRIRLSGDGDTELNLCVYDESGRLVASDTLGSGDDRMVFVTPAWTGPFKIKTVNRGCVYNRYILILD